MAVAFNIKVKHYGKTVVSKKKVDAKEVSTLIGINLKQAVAGMVGNAAVTTVRQHNEMVLLKAAIFFQRVVTRTPKDETYYDPKTKVYHKADSDFVWQSWKVLYWGKSVSALEMGAGLFENESDFNSKAKIQKIAQIIQDRLFGGEQKFEKRTTRIRNIRFENTHPRFAMLEYGTYEKSSGEISEGPKHQHGVVGGYSVQAPYGMYRITQAEMEAMSMQDIANWSFRDFKSKMAKEGVTKIPSQKQMKKISKLISDKTHLSGKDIENIATVMGGNK